MADDLNWLLHNLVNKVPGTRCAVLLSVDGLAKAWHGVTPDNADRLAAIAGSMCGIARQFGAQLSGAGADGMRQVVAELTDCLVFTAAASAGTVLVVAADLNVDTRNVSYEMQYLCGRVPDHIATQTRNVLAPGTGPR